MNFLGIPYFDIEPGLITYQTNAAEFVLNNLIYCHYDWTAREIFLLGLLYMNMYMAIEIDNNYIYCVCE